MTTTSMVIADQSIVQALSDAPEIWQRVEICAELMLGRDRVRHVVLEHRFFMDYTKRVWFFADNVTFYTSMHVPLEADSLLINLSEQPILRVDFGGKQKCVGGTKIVWQYPWYSTLRCNLPDRLHWLLRLAPAKYRQFHEENLPSLFTIKWPDEGIYVIERDFGDGGTGRPIMRSGFDSTNGLTAQA